MGKIKVEELDKISQKVKENNLIHPFHLMLCGGTGCISNKSLKIKEVMESEIKKKGLDKKVSIVITGCNGFCAIGPIVIVEPSGIFYHSLTEEVIPELIEEHFVKGKPFEKLMYVSPKDNIVIPKLEDIPFFNKQTLITLRNRGIIDPENIDEYIARGGYKALAKILTKMTQDEIINEIKRSNLRGRGGAGFPAGLKWEITKKAKGEMKYIVCNADEGDPGAYMDRSIIESDPHSVLEGMLIGARAIGASEGYIYIRTEYPLARERLKIAIEQAREYGLMGENIFGTDFNCDIFIRQGSGAFVCGEATALIASIEGKYPEPRHKPPHLSESGLWGKPTCLNNVETFATVPAIINNGFEWFTKIGTEKSKGTKVFSLVGKINNSGLVEVPMGITLREIIYDIGGGIPKGRKFKAVLTGGPSGGCIPLSLIDIPVDYESLSEAGSIMGSGGMIVMDEDNCMVDVARFYIEFTNDESCGRCSSCRDGSSALLEILERICSGEGKMEDLDFLEELSLVIKDASMCGLGQSLPNPVLSTLRYFREEYEAHIKEKKCPAKVCKALIKYHIDESKCTGCMLCAKNCANGAISGEKKKPYKIDPEKCIKCGVCFEMCRFKAVIVE